MPPASELALAAAILFAAAILQAAVGFGMALFAVPLLVLTGRPMPEAVALVGGALLAQTSYGVHVMRAHLHWRTSLGTAAFSWLALPIGIAGMVHLSSADPQVVKQVVGIAVLALVTAWVFIKPTPREVVARKWTVVAGASSGLLIGFIGIGGPPLVFYALAHAWDKDRFRVYLWSQFLLVSPLLLATLTWRFGWIVPQLFAVGVATMPLAWLGTKIGVMATARWERKQLQIATTILLYAIGASATAAPLLSRAL